MPFENVHSGRLRNPGDFEEGSFRTQEITTGVTAIIGRLKGKTTRTAQAYRFDKAKFTAEQARAWLKEHDIKLILFEPAKAAQKALCPSCGSTADAKDGAPEDYECEKCGTEMVSFSTKLRKLLKVNVFRAGKWKGFAYTLKHIDEMIANFKKGVLRSYLKVTSDGSHGRGDRPLLDSLAFGWVERLWREGEKLFADFKQVPEAVAKLISGGALKQKSIELWPDFRTTDGGKHGAVLESVLFFGTGLPAVHGLEEAAEMFTEVTNEGDKHNVVLDEMTSHAPGDVGTGDTNNNPAPSGGRSRHPARGKHKSNSQGRKMEIEAKEYQTLVADQAKLAVMNDEVARRKTEVETLTASLSESEGKVTTLTGERDEALKAVAETKKATVETFVASVVSTGQLEPSRKDAVIGELCKMTDEQAEDYRKRLEGLPSLFKTDAVKTDGPKEPEGTAPEVDTDKRDAAIKAAMKADSKLSYAQANEKLYGSGGGRLV